MQEHVRDQCPRPHEHERGDEDEQIVHDIDGHLEEEDADVGEEQGADVGCHGLERWNGGQGWPSGDLCAMLNSGSGKRADGQAGCERHATSSAESPITNHQSLVI